MAIKQVISRGKVKYRSSYRDVNSRSYTSKTFSTEKEAKLFEASLAIARSGGVQVKKQSTQTLKQFWTEYVEKFAKHDLAAITLDVYKADSRGRRNISR